MHAKDKDNDHGLARLVAIMHQLRSPGGCPWDQEQTHDSLRPYLIEEAYEVLSALDDGDDQELRDELGDLLLQVVFHAELAAERGAFAIDDVVAAISDKLERRHPHVFADLELADADAVAANWARIKARERREKSDGPAHPSALDGLPRALPSVLRAHRVGEKAAGIGFDWPQAAPVRAKLDEELSELDRAVELGDQDAIIHELGDVLFTVANYARHLRINADTALEQAVARFERRFRDVEQDLSTRGIDPHEAGAEALELAWERAKEREKALAQRRR